MNFSYRCSICQRTFALEPQLTLCPDCQRDQVADQPLSGVLEVVMASPPKKPGEIFSWLPVEREFFPAVPVGNTPLWQPANLRRRFGFAGLYLKDDGSNPTSSFKDRASFLVSAFAQKHRIGSIALASTGNAGSSMAGIGAAAGQSITLFLPKSAPAAKLIQALQYGAQVYRVDGTYDLAYDISLEYSRRRGGMNRNTAYNPMTIEGKKTVSLELFQQLGRAPDVVFVPVGDGCILAGVYKGFRDLQQFGLIAAVPRIIGVQAKTSAALYHALHAGSFVAAPTSTIADSICVDVPRNGRLALALLQQYGGELITVEDAEIIAAQAELSASTGLFTEPAGAAAYAGFVQTAARLEADAVIVVLATGSGLKDSATAQRGVIVPDRLISSVDDLHS
ncbi:MAG TPA: pyridoxal-phosphate dependent enzyme [Desulforhopalus sp.]|nr:pyridoxal-phosphate dependent enzyme [Desulforhopalus sp.]